MNDVKHFTALMKSKVKRLEREVVEQVSSDIEKSARRNFNSARNKVSTDNPYVEVIRTKNGQNSATVSCIGDQVLFIEFGVGLSNMFRPNGVSLSTGFSFDENNKIVEAQRPAGVVPLGQYGKGHGKDEWWVRPSATGIPRLPTEQQVHKRDKNGNIIGFRTDVVWTSGHPPIRALWRARNSALQKLYNPKTLKLPTRYLPAIIE